MSDTAYDASPAMMAARGQTYGKRKQQIEAQRAVPMGRSPVETTAAQAARPQPAAPGAFLAPTARPQEPITAGAPFGPGPGPMAAGIPMMTRMQSALDELRQAAMLSADDDLLDLLDAYGDEL
jgi:hypothetical protein